MVDLDGRILHGGHGPCPGLRQTVPRAKFFAAILAFDVIEPHTLVHCDCKYVVDGFALGEDHAANRHGPHSDLWAELFQIARARNLVVGDPPLV